MVFSLLKQVADCAFFLAMAKAGNSIAARMAMIAITTSNSIKVKARNEPFRHVRRAKTNEIVSER